MAKAVKNSRFRAHAYGIFLFMKNSFHSARHSRVFSSFLTFFFFLSAVITPSIFFPASHTKTGKTEVKFTRDIAPARPSRGIDGREAPTIPWISSRERMPKNCDPSATLPGKSSIAGGLKEFQDSRNPALNFYTFSPFPAFIGRAPPV